MNLNNKRNKDFCRVVLPLHCFTILRIKLFRSGIKCLLPKGLGGTCLPFCFKSPLLL